ncbi:hypothetical protein DIZ76_014835 [Coccidioides immitis]|nr:hypothetical protein DIZ76_014835 [Coccidioides immitis]
MFTDRRQGVSHVFSAESPSTVAQLMNSPGTWDYREKVPTIIAVAGDHGNRETLWGAEVKTGMSSSAWFKIGMAPKLCATPEDDPLLQQAVGKGLMRIPDGHTPQSLCKEFLKHLHAHIMNAVNKEYSGIIETTPIDFVFSAPAERGKEYTGNLKKAAESAGFRSRLKDKSSFIDEPEAAALLAFECYLDKKHSKKNVMVVDMGGGTVVRISLTPGYWEHKIIGGQDLINYEIKSRSPFRVAEACAGTSAMCGGTTIDRKLHKLMGEKYGNDFLGKSAKSISQRSDFMKEFEDIKCRFKGEPGCHYRLLLWMNRESGSGYDAETGTITLTSEEIIAMFDQVIKPSIDKISQQISQLKKQNQNPVQVSDRSAHFEKNHFSDKFARDKQAVVLCGGLGGNVHVFKRIQQFCKSELGDEAVVIVPSQSWSAIARGAALSRMKRKAMVTKTTYVAGVMVSPSTGSLCPEKTMDSRQKDPPGTVTEGVQILGTIQLDFSEYIKRSSRQKNKVLQVQIGHKVKAESGEVEFAARIGKEGKPFACAKFTYEDVEEELELTTEGHEGAYDAGDLELEEEEEVGDDDEDDEGREEEADEELEELEKAELMARMSCLDGEAGGGCGMTQQPGNLAGHRCGGKQAGEKKR